MIELTEKQVRDLVDYLTRTALNQLAILKKNEQQKEINFDTPDMGRKNLF